MSSKHLLIAIDIDDPIEAVAKAAKSWNHDGDDKISILGVAPKLSFATANSGVSSAVQRAEMRLIEDLRGRLKGLCKMLEHSCDIHMTAGTRADQIIDAAILNKADLIMKPADHFIDQAKPLFGSLEKKLIRKSPLPVWIVRKETEDTPKTLVVAVDNTDQAAHPREAKKQANAIIDHAAHLAARFQISTIHVLHSWTLGDHSALESPHAGLSPLEIETYMNEWEVVNQNWINQFVLDQEHRLGGDIRLKPELTLGHPHVAIPERLKDLGADLLVIGSSNRTGLGGLLIGNTAEGIINQTSCGVYIVKPAGLL